MLPSRSPGRSLRVLHLVLLLAIELSIASQGDGKALSDKSRRGCRTKSLFLFLTLILLTLLLLSNFVVDPYASAFWNWSVPAAVVEPSLRKFQHESRAMVEQQPKCKRDGSARDRLPKGIAAASSDLELHSLGKSSKSKVQETPPSPKLLLAIAAGIKQKSYVDKIARKFVVQNAKVVLFHYDGVVDKWHDLPWSVDALHIVAINQTKWWYAKRFLHPDIVAPYEYVFVWDEDLSVDHFHLDRYLTIVKEEQLDISQPALEPRLSEIHHRITIRKKKMKVHRRILKRGGTGTLCYENSTSPPCTGWVEGMAPVFTREAWKCVWHLIQNDLVHGWGMDFKLGYCAQGDRSRRVGVVDTEYIVHRGIPSLGGPAKNKSAAGYGHDARSEIRRRSYAELDIFSRRWKKAVQEDECWRDPYKRETSTYGGKYME